MYTVQQWVFNLIHHRVLLENHTIITTTTLPATTPTRDSNSSRDRAGDVIIHVLGVARLKEMNELVVGKFSDWRTTNSNLNSTYAARTTRALVKDTPEPKYTRERRHNNFFIVTRRTVPHYI